MQALSSASGHHNHEKITGCLQGTSPRLQVCLLTHAKSPLLSPGAGGERRWNALSKPQTSHRPPCRVEHVWSHDGTAGWLRPRLVNTYERKSCYGALVPCQGAAARTQNPPPQSNRREGRGVASPRPEGLGRGAAARGGSACSGRAADGWERRNIPLTGDGKRCFLIWRRVPKEEEQAKKIKKCPTCVSGVKPAGANVKCRLQ